MNDFTREELEAIENCVWIYDDMREDEGALHAPLLKKIKSMIDNFCEHRGDDRMDDNFCNACKRKVM